MNTLWQKEVVSQETQLMLTLGEPTSQSGQLIKGCERVAVFCSFQLSHKKKKLY